MQATQPMSLAPVAPNAGEIATTAAATQAMAAVQARYALAVARPRDDDQVRASLLKDCRRPAFAEVARYSKPIGGSPVEGPSIRFVEAALRAFGNVYREVSVLYDTDRTRVVRVAVTDLEANVTHQTEIAVAKTVERRRVRDGQRVLGERVNTRGQLVYIVEATDDEVATKQANLVSKAIRELGLRLLPGDLVDEGQAVCLQTRLADAKEDPEAARKRLVDSFVALGVQPAELSKYLGHPVGQSTPKEVADLRQIYASIRAGETSWREVIDARLGDDDDDNDDKPAPNGKGAERLKAKVKAANGEEAGNGNA